jgi:N-methylhydantoinase A
MTSTDLDAAAVDAVLAELEAAARASFEAQAPSGEEPRLERSIAMRYQGQNYEQEVPLSDGDVDLEATFERYHELHEGFYGYRFDGAPIELVRVSVTLVGAEIELPPLHIESVAGGRAGRTDDVHFEDAGFVPTAIVARDSVDGEQAGPVIVQSVDTTVVVPPGWVLRGLPDGVMELRKDGA